MSDSHEKIEESTLPEYDGNEMSENGDLNHHASDEDDEKHGVIYTKEQHREPATEDLTVSRDTIQDLGKSTRMKRDTQDNKRKCNSNTDEILRMVETLGRDENVEIEGFYARTEAFAREGDLFNGKPGERLAKATASAEAGIGRACVEFEVFDAEAKGPNVSASAEASVVKLRAEAMARAELGSVSANVGPVGLKVGLGVDTGVAVGVVNWMELKFFGTGFAVGLKPSVSLLGSEVSCSVM